MYSMLVGDIYIFHLNRLWASSRQRPNLLSFGNLLSSAQFQFLLLGTSRYSADDCTWPVRGKELIPSGEKECWAYNSWRTEEWGKIAYQPLGLGFFARRLSTFTGLR